MKLNIDSYTVRQLKFTLPTQHKNNIHIYIIFTQHSWSNYIRQETSSHKI